MVNVVTVNLISVFAAQAVPVGSFTVNTDPAKETTHSAEAGAVTENTLGDPEVSTAMPAPDKVMMISATLPPLVRAWMGVNVNEAVVTEAFTTEVSVIWRAATRTRVCVCNGQPTESNVDTLTLTAAAALHICWSGFLNLNHT